MATTTQTKTIDGVAYAVTQLPARRAARLLNRLLRVFGPALGGLAGAAKGGASLETADLSSVGPVLEGLFARLSEDEQDHLINELLATATVDGKEVLPVLDLHFQGRLGALFKLVGFAVKVNFEDFSGGLIAAAKAAGLLQLKAGRGSEGSTTSPTTG